MLAKKCWLERTENDKLHVNDNNNNDNNGNYDDNKVILIMII